MRILAFDTSTELCSVALMIDNNTLLERSFFSNKEHTKHLLFIINDLLKESNIKLKNLNIIAFSHGPGSFTGIRIGMCVAQALSFASNINFISVSTLETLAEGAWRQSGIKKVLTSMSYNYKNIYWSTYIRQKNGIWIGEKNEILTNVSNLISLTSNLYGNWIMSGSNLNIYPILLNNNKLSITLNKNRLPQAKDILKLALYKYYYNSSLLNKIIEPKYINNKFL